MKITIEDAGGKYTVEPADEYDTFQEYVEYLIIPMFKMMGFSQELIDDFMNQPPDKEVINTVVRRLKDIHNSSSLSPLDHIKLTDSIRVLEKL